MSETKIDTVNIKIPCNPEYAQLVRLAVSSIASRMNFPITEIEKLKSALSALCQYFTMQSPQKQQTVELSLNIYASKLIVTIEHSGQESKNSRKMLEKIITTLMINHYIDNFRLGKKIYIEKQVA